MLGVKDLDLHVELIDLMKPRRWDIEGFFNALQCTINDRPRTDGWNVMLIPHSRNPYANFNYHFIRNSGQQRMVTVGRIIVFNKCDRQSF